MHRGYIKLWRKIKEWEWYKESNTLHLFLHLMLNANYKASRFMGQEIKRGDIVVGRKQLSLDTGITEQSVRTSIERLKSTSEITSRSTNKFSIITLCNYETYQNDNFEINQQNVSPSTTDQPATNQQLTTSKEVNKEKKEKNNTYTVEFESFWKQYPKKIGKGEAYKKWMKIPTNAIDKINKALQWQIKCDQWIKDNGQFIPLPSTYLNQCRWEDEPIKQPTKQSDGGGYAKYMA